MLKTKINQLRLLAYLEGISFLVLIGIGMPLKYVFALPEPNLYIGMIHGLLFIAYCTWVMILKADEQWSSLKALSSFLT